MEGVYLAEKWRFKSSQVYEIIGVFDPPPTPTPETSMKFHSDRTMLDSRRFNISRDLMGRCQWT